MVQIGTSVRRLNFPFYRNYSEVKTFAQECEEQGFDSIFVNDHLLSFGPGGNLRFPYYDCWTLIAALSRDTQKIKIGSLCSCYAFRSPSVLAKQIASIDDMSNGRIIVGMGAGWYEREFKAFGIPFYPPGQRVEQLREFLTVMKKIWTEEKPLFKGKYYEIDDAGCNPPLVQKPHPTIWVGCQKPRMLRLAADLADGWNQDGGKPTLPLTLGRIELIKNRCKRNGRDFGRMTISMWNNVLIGYSESEIKEQWDDYLKYGAVTTGADAQAQLSYAWKGTPQEVCDLIKPYVEIGVSHISLSFATSRARGLFADEALKVLRHL